MLALITPAPSPQARSWLAVLPLFSPLMEKLIEAYKTVNPNATLELQTTDSTTGVSGALDGTYTIGMASRELKDSEVEGGAKATVLANGWHRRHRQQRQPH